MQEFVEDHGLEHVTHMADTDERVWDAFGVVGQPTWVFIDGETGESELVLGSLSQEDLQARLEALEN